MKRIESPLSSGNSGEAVQNLHDALMKLVGGGAIKIGTQSQVVRLLKALEPDIKAGHYGSPTQRVVSRVQTAVELDASGAVDPPTARFLNELLIARGLLNETAPPPPAPVVAADGGLSGRLYLPNGAPAANLEVRAYSIAFGGGEVPLGKGASDAEGKFSFAAGKAGERIQLQIKVVMPDASEKDLMRPRLIDLPVKDLRLVVPESLQGKAEAEFDRLVAAAETAGVGLDALAKAVEDDTRRDLGTLTAATGWDARLLALGSVAASRNAQTKLGAEVHYALMRVSSLGTDQDVATLSKEEVRAGLKHSSDSGIATFSDEKIEQILTQHAGLASRTALESKVGDSVSSLAEILGQAAIGPEEQKRFAAALSTDWNTADELWKQAAAGGLNKGTIAKLQALGQLSTLTRNNGPLAGKLAQDFAAAPTDLPELAKRGYYRAETWMATLGQLSGGDAAKLEKLIPAGYAGDTLEARANAYATEMAQKVRRTFPGEVIAARVELNEIAVADSAAGQTTVADFVTAASANGYRIGRTPLTKFFKERGAPLLNALGAAEREQVTRSTRLLHRLYQMTPDDDSMVALAAHGVSRAGDITAMPEGEFVKSFVPRLAGNEVIKPLVAQRVYRKAQQIETAARMIVTLAQLARNATPARALTPSNADQQLHFAQIVNDIPSLEGLLGNQDFCECEHCRSVLSPAAYFVDLLNFLDPGLAPTGTPSPFDELSARRPDLQEIALTCENTNTALPYIDLINEILEAYIDAGLAPSARTYESGSLTTADLIAEPERISAPVYDMLRGEKYPVSSPFDLWTETMRAYCNRFGTPYADLVGVFRQPATLFQAVGASTLTRGKLLAEQLGLTERDYELLTTAGAGANGVPALYGHLAAHPVTVADLARVDVLTRQLGITVAELTDLVMTRFINPHIATFLRLQRAGVASDSVFAWLGANGYPALSAADQAELLAKLGPMQVDGVAGSVWLQQRWNAGDFDDLLVIRRQPNQCDPATMRMVQVRAGNAITESTLLRLNVFVRLWRKLGWRPDELDAALTRFFPATGYANVAGIGPAIRTALLGLAHLEDLHRLCPLGRNARRKWLAVWGAIPDHGKSLYDELFIDGQSAAQRAVFDPALGERLPEAAAPALSTQLTAVMAGSGASAEEIDLICSDQFAPGVVPPQRLTMATVSKIYRYALLAKALKIGIRDLVTLRQLSGSDVFVSALNANVPDAAVSSDDLIFENTVRFVARVRRFQAVGLKTADLRYLIRDELEQATTVANPTARALGVLRAIRAGVERAILDNQMPANADDVTTDWLLQNLSVLLPRTVSEQWVAMLDGSNRYEQAAAAVAPLFRGEDLQSYPELSTRFDAVRDLQILSCAGVLSDVRRAAILQDLRADPANQPRNDLAATLEPLLVALTGQAKAFHAGELAVSVPNFPAALAFAALYDNAVPAERRRAVAAALLPRIRDVAQRAAGSAAVAAFYGREPDVLESWMRDVRLAVEPAVEPHQTAVTLAARGVQGEYFAAPDLTGAVLAVVQPSPVVSTDVAAHRSARFRGYFSVPARGTYRFQFVARTPGETCALRVIGIDGADLAGLTTVANPIVSGAPVELQADTLYGLDASVRNLAANGGEFRLLSSQDPSLQNFASVECWPLANLDVPQALLGRFDRLLGIQEKLSLTPTELNWMFDRPADFGPSSLVELPAPSGALAAALKSRFGFLSGVADYCAQRSRDEWLPEQVGAAIAALTQRGATNDAATREAALATLADALASVFRESATAVTKALTALQFEALLVQPAASGGFEFRFTLIDVAALVRLAEALRIARVTGVTCTDLARWAQWPVTAALASDVRATIRSRYADQDWRRTIQPIADPLRQRRRDALVAHLLHRLHFERMEQLYAFFLIDPGMEPVVLTSRIRLAIATVQNFVNRCLQNHEPNVSPAHIDATRWSVIRRYRIWEASRKILLFPENWLEPEFRTDASPLFKSMMGELLQGDLTDDAVEGAVFKYLQGLEQVARLQMVASYEEWKDGFTVLHVIGRTFASPHKYFYRRLLRGIDWTAWEPIGVDIEGEHVVATIWRDRLCILWLTVIEGSRQTDTAKSKKISTYDDGQTDSDSLGAQLYVEIWANYAEYVNGDWLARQSGGKQASALLDIGRPYEPKHLFVHALKTSSADYPDSVEVHAYHAADPAEAVKLAFRFTSPFDAAQVIENEAPRELEFQGTTAKNWTRQTVSEWPLTVNNGASERKEKTWLEVLKNKFRPYGQDRNFYLLASASSVPMPAGSRLLEQPFFYEDQRNTFFVTTDYDEYVIEGPVYDGILDRWKDYRVQKPPRVPVPVNPYDPRVKDIRKPPTEDPAWGKGISPDSLIKPKDVTDYLVGREASVLFGDKKIGQTGSLEIGSDIVARNAS